MSGNYNHIIDYIGRDGVKTTPAQSRLRQPRPGDLVRIPEELQVYPFTQGEFARIDHLSGDRIGVCCGLGSCFLLPESVSISGGPFKSIALADIEPECSVGPSPMWNWGDNSSGADMGVDYVIMRPIFRLLRHPDGRSKSTEAATG